MARKKNQTQQAKDTQKQEELQNKEELKQTEGNVEGTEGKTELPTGTENGDEGNESQDLEQERGETKAGITVDELPFTPAPKEERPVAEAVTTEIKVGEESKAPMNINAKRQAGERRLDTGFAATVPNLAKGHASLCEALNNFACEMSPTSGSTAQQQMQAQVRFLENLVDFLTYPCENIREANREIIDTVAKNQKHAFGIEYMNKNMDQINMTSNKIMLLQSLLHLYRTAAVRGMEAAIKEVDIPLVAKYIEKAYPRKPQGSTTLKELFRLG